MVIFISIFNSEKNLLCIFYQLFEHVEILYSKNFSGYFTQPTAFTINTHLYFDKINVLQVCILTVESYSMGYLEMIVRRSGIIVVIICQTINGAEIISISPFITIIYPISTITGLVPAFCTRFPHEVNRTIKKPINKKSNRLIFSFVI